MKFVSETKTNPMYGRFSETLQFEVNQSNQLMQMFMEIDEVVRLGMKAGYNV
jgi:hypothetical protein